MAGEQRVMIGGLPIQAIPLGDGSYALATAAAQAIDIEIGAVELKDGTTDTRAVIDANGLDVDVTRLPAGEAHIGQVGGHGIAIQATLNALAPVIAAAGDYAANDVFSDAVTDTTGHPFVFAGAARVAGGVGLITRVSIDFSVDALTARVRVHFFNAAPTTTEQDDNAAFNLTVADRTKHIGYIDLPALTDFGAVSKAQNIADRLGFDLASGTSLYAICQWLDAVTNESAGMTCCLEIDVLQH